MSAIAEIRIRGYGVNARRASFVPREWLEPTWFQIADRRKWESPCPVHYWFRLADGKLQLRLEVGPPEAGAPFDREKFVSTLRTSLGEKDREVTGTYTRIRLRSTSVGEEVDIEQLTGKMQKLWKDIGGSESAQLVLAAASAAVR